MISAHMFEVLDVAATHVRKGLGPYRKVRTVKSVSILVTR